MYIVTSLILHLSIFISSHIVNYNYFIYLHKILIENILKIKSNFIKSNIWFQYK